MGEEKLDIFSQLDIRIDKKWNFKKFSFNLFLEAQNVLAQNNPQPPEYGLNREETGVLVQPRSLIEIMQDSGSPIPSIGLVVDF